MLLSILTPTVPQRAALYRDLKRHLRDQQTRHNLRSKTEFLSELDSGEKSVGEKRNALVQRAQGLFVAHVDDDDWVSDDYLRLICEAIEQHPDIDVIGLRGEMTIRGKDRRVLLHALPFDHLYEQDGVCYRPPNHLNPVRRDIALQYPFPALSSGEDTSFALAMVAAQALKRQYMIEHTIYHYRFHPELSLTQQRRKRR